MKFGITVNVGNFSSLRCESSDQPTLKECYEECLFVIEGWDEYEAVEYWKNKLIKKIKIIQEKGVDTTVETTGETKLHSPGFKDYEPEKTSVVEKTIMKGKTTPAAANLDDRYNYLSQKGEPYICNRCGAFISWDKYKLGVKLPIHVDKDGKAIGDGSCPNFG